MTKDQRICPGCLLAFQPGEREHNPRKWCSQVCRRWASKHPGVPRPPLRNCLRCAADISARAGQAKYCSTVCRDMASGKRQSEPQPLTTCALPECGASFLPLRMGQTCCSELHGKRLYNRKSRADGRQQPEPWNDRRRDRYHRRRALKKAASTGEPVLLTEIAQRDNWTCRLCSQPVDMERLWPDPFSPSLDHVVPLTRGGSHDPGNVALAHLRCNTAKNNRTDSEYLLSLTG